MFKILLVIILLFATIALIAHIKGNKITIEKDLALDFPLDDKAKDVLYYASMAPSGHNTQPWIVEAGTPGVFTVRLDSSRKLPEVDPDLRETCLSIGTFLENMHQALLAYHANAGFEFESIDITSENPVIARVHYTELSAPTPETLALMLRRHTDKRPFLDQALDADSVDKLLAEFPEIRYFPKGTAEFEYIRSNTINANAAQAASETKRAELAEWMRFSDAEAIEKADGLPAEQMGLSGIVKTAFYIIFDREKAKGEAFAQQAVKLAEKQTSNCAGFFVLTSGNTQSIVRLGMRAEQFWLTATAEDIAIHPMTQILEEAPFKDEIDNAIGTEQAQMIFRAGYVEDYGSNNAIRRQLRDFVRE